MESLYYEGAYGDYEVYSFVYSLRTDRPDLVEEDVLTDVDSQGWVSRPYYVATGGYPYLLMENGDIAAVYYSNSVPSIPGFWYTCSAIPQEERYQLAAIAAFAQTDALEQLYLGNPDWDQERTFTREELEAAGYQAETLPQNPWRRVVIDPWITQEEYLRNTFQSRFSASLTQRRLDAMFSGPDAPISFMKRTCISGMMSPADRRLSPTRWIGTASPSPAPSTSRTSRDLNLPSLEHAHKVAGWRTTHGPSCCRWMSQPFRSIL